MQSHQPTLNNSNFEMGSGSGQGFNDRWGDGQQNFNNQGFNGDFGAFDEGYYDNGNLFNQGAGSNSDFRYRRPQRQPFYGAHNAGVGGGYREDGVISAV
jgi:hypothetical protein